MNDTNKLTPKQEKFCLLYIELGNAAEAYKCAYSCANMAATTIQREATRLLANHTINHTITTLRARASEKAVLDKAWVLAKIRKNIEVSLAEQTLTLKVQKRDKESGAVEVVEVETSAHDAAAANKGLELLARHLGLFEVDNSQQGNAAGEAGKVPAQPVVPGDAREDHLADLLAKRYGAGLRVVEGGKNASEEQREPRIEPGARAVPADSPAEPGQLGHDPRVVMAKRYATALSPPDGTKSPRRMIDGGYQS